MGRIDLGYRMLAGCIEGGGEVTVVSAGTLIFV